MAQSNTALKQPQEATQSPFLGWVFPLRQVDQDAIRDAMVTFCFENTPLAHRLQCMVELSACLSGRESELGHPGSTVGQSLACFESESELKAFSLRLSKRMPQGGDGVGVLAQMVQMRLLQSEWGVGEDFRTLWSRSVVARLGSTRSILKDPQTAWRALCSQIAALNAVIPGRVDSFSAQFCANYWSRCFWRNGEMTLAHTQRLLALIGLVRMTIACDPDVRAVRGKGREALTEAFDAAARKNTWVALRAFDQHPAFEAVLDSVDPLAGLNETRALCQI
jgi:hypothetical protein